MAVAAYASVLSLLRVVDSIQHPSRLRLFPEGTTTQIDALRDKLSFLQDFLEAHSSKMMTKEDIDGSVRRIPRVTCDAEILIDNYVVDNLYRELYPPNDVVGPSIGSSFNDELLRAIREIESVNEALSKLSTIQRDQERPIRDQVDKFTGNEPLKNKMVGFDDQLKRVLEKLTSNQRNLVIVPIVGMGGIGKTTLARSVFDHPYNSDHFHVRIWLTISQDYSLRTVLQGLLADGVLEDKKDRGSDVTESELITQLYKKLFGQRYLIVMDDVWSAEAWDDLRRVFPDNENNSRVVVTTRSYDIASCVDSQNNNTYSMEFLDEDKSWDLFIEKAFEKGGRISVELEEIGRKISKRCKGLPILLASIGGLLASSDMTVSFWRSVKKDINSFVNSANDEYCSKILSLSYHQLPIHLKPCFLYTRHFKEDSTIKVSQLIERWVSHGIVKPIKGKTLEEAARKYAEDLVRRNMLLSRNGSRNRNIEYCSVHDLLRGMSIKESEKERFLELPKRIQSTEKEQCVICNKRKRYMNKVPVSEILGLRSGGEIPVCSSSCVRSPFREFARSRFVVAARIKSQNVPMLTTYRSIALRSLYDRISVFHTIRLIWNLEILDIQDIQVVLPKELWEMPQLRHVKASLVTIRNPGSTEHDVTILENLQTLTNLKNFEFTDDVIRRIPNLRHLGVRYGYNCISEDGVDLSCSYLRNINRLQKLESLYIQCIVVSMDFNVVSLPCSLKRLTLDDCKISWDELSIIGSSLPNLEVLKLQENSVVGEEWGLTVDGGESLFLSLKYLELSDLNLELWRVDDGATQFPALETILLYKMEALEEIPPEIGELPSLNSIHLTDCSVKVVDSADDIAEDQRSNGNEMLVITVKETTGRTYQVGGANRARAP